MKYFDLSDTKPLPGDRLFLALNALDAAIDLAESCGASPRRIDTLRRIRRTV